MAWTLHEGDCVEVMKRLPDSSIDLILTDPPYFRMKSEPWDRQWDKPEAFLLWIDSLCAQWQRLLKPNGSLYVFASPRMAARVEVTVAKRFNVCNHIVWRKEAGRHKGTCLDSCRTYFPQTERIIFAEHYGADNAAKGEAGYITKCDELRGFVFEPLRAYLDAERERAGVTKPEVDAAWQAWRGGRGGMSSHWFSTSQWALPTRENYEWLQQLFNTRGGDYLRRDYEDLRRDYEDLRRDYEDLRRPFDVTATAPYTDVWDFPTVAHYPGKHPCEKPQELLRHIINVSSKRGAVVLDCFAGSGATAVAAEHCGRDCILVELSSEYCESIRRRMDEPMQAALL